MLRPEDLDLTDAIKDAAMSVVNYKDGARWHELPIEIKEELFRDSEVAIRAAIPHILAQVSETVFDTPTRWWRAIEPDGTVWCESSSEDEVRDRSLTRHTIQQLWTNATITKWRGGSMKKDG